MMKKGEKYFIGPASIPRRLLAFVMDLIIINFIIFSPFERILAKIIPVGSVADLKSFLAENPSIISFISLLSFIAGMLILLYFSYFEYKMQQTPGKMMLRLYAVPEDKKASFLKYLLSNITFIPSFPFYLLWIIDPIHMLVSPKSQRLMERLSKIIVVQKYRY